MQQAAAMIASVTTTIAAIMVAANAGARVTGWGFVVFAFGSLAWIVVGQLSGQPSLMWQNVALLAINLAGVWRWLGLRSRYAKGAAKASGDGS